MALCFASIWIIAMIVYWLFIDATLMEMLAHAEKQMELVGLLLKKKYVYILFGVYPRSELWRPI